MRNPIRWVTIAFAVLVLGSLGLIFGLRLQQGALQAESPLVGKPAPDFNLPGLDGGRIRLSDYSGQVTVLNFWASWCVPCREEAPRLEAFSQRYASQGVTVIGVVWNDSTSAARSFRSEFGLTFPQAVDGRADAAIEFGVRGVPETYVISPDGIVMAKVIGAIGPTTLEDLLNDVLLGVTRTERNERDYRTRPPG